MISSMKHLDSNEVLYEEGTCVTKIALIVQGSVSLYHSGAFIKLGSGDFIGVADLIAGSYLFSSKAIEESVICVFEVTEVEDLFTILEEKREYAGIIMMSTYMLINTLNNKLEEVTSYKGELEDFVKCAYKTYEELLHKYRDYSSQAELEVLEGRSQEIPVDYEWMTEVSQMITIPPDVIRTYYSYIPGKVVRELKQIEPYLKTLSYNLKNVGKQFRYLNQLLCNESENCFLKIVAYKAMEEEVISSERGELTALFQEVFLRLQQSDAFSLAHFGSSLIMDRNAMKTLYLGVQSEVTKEKEDTSLQLDKSQEEVVKILHNSMQQIFEYSGLSNDKIAKMKEAIVEFRQLKDKNSISEEVRSMRKKLTENYYPLYESVFLRAYEEKVYPRVIELFLSYGFLDETLFSEEQLTSLYNLNIPQLYTDVCHCYTLKEWFIQIYEGKKEPSKDEFDQSYQEMIRKEKIGGKITQIEEIEALNDGKRKLAFEMHHMLTKNIKLVNGKISTFVPMLYGELLPENMQECYVTPQKVNEVIHRIRSIDFSIFYREAIYSNESIGIVKEVAQKECVPDIILFPTHGSNGVMWQEISNKVRSSEGRFFLPIFHENSLYDIILKVLGRYRWELCRTLQGGSWNDIKNRCLTSEYGDYLQFYRKNKELSEEKKGKIKSQLQKARASSKEFFVTDYEIWIKYESKGAIRLNSIARTILATYCPFTKAIRDHLRENKNFGDAMARFERETFQKRRILEAKLLRLEKQNEGIPRELLDTKEFYER